MDWIGGKNMSGLSDKQEEIYEWCKREYGAEFNEDLLAIIIDRIMWNEREAVLELKKNIKARPHLDLGTMGIVIMLIDEIFGEKLSQ